MQRETLTGVLIFFVLLVVVGWWWMRGRDDVLPATGEWWAIEGATVHTMDDKHGSLRNGVVLLRGGVIAQVGYGLKLPEGTRVVKAYGKILTPGIVLAGTRLGAVEISLERSTRNDTMPTPAPIRASFRVFDGLNHNSSLIPVARIEGITAVMVQPFGGLVSGQSALIDLYGHAEQMKVRDALAVHATIPLGRQAYAWTKLRESLRAARFFHRYRSQYHQRKLRKLGLSLLDLETLARVVQRKIPLVLHVNRAADILTALRFADEFRLKLILADVAEGWQVANAIARAKVPVLIGRPHNLPTSFERIGNRYDNAALLHKAGVSLAFSAQGGAHNIRSRRHEAGIAVAWGLPETVALQALTRNLYRFFGLARRYGTITRGKVANLVLWNGNPLELSSRAVNVWIRGHSVPMVSRQTLLRDRYRNLNTLYRQPSGNKP